ncbi:hypothetical protein [Luteolibacter yonseiensis]|uniref:hypothetical protein n=1 Tax=Luteolibacter yonseiensis TaxID=1144680 RepID=UPI002D7F653D|nr:hypothetical protein [Luteolibacter yonseiensis]
MKSILHKSTVLVLNRNWQAIHVKTPAEAFCMMATGAANGLDIRGEDFISPLKWEDWLRSPVREEDQAVNTPRGAVRVPTVIVAANYSKIPLCQPRFGARGIWERMAASANTRAASSRPVRAISTTSFPVPAAGRRLGRTACCPIAR